MPIGADNQKPVCKEERMMKKRVLIISVCVEAALLVALCVLLAVVNFRKPNQTAYTGTMTLTCHEDGQTVLSWPESASATEYQIQVLKNGEVLFEKLVESSLECALPELPLSEKLTVRVSPAGKRVKFDALEVTAVLAPPVVEAPVRTDDVENGTVKLQFDQPADSTIGLFWGKTPQEQELLKNTTQGQATISFGENGDFAEPVYGEDIILTYVCSKTLAGMELRWQATEQIRVCREDFLGRELGLEMVDKGDNRFVLYWKETKGDHQLLQLWNEGTKAWDTVKEYSHRDMLIYDTGYLPKYVHYTYRVVGVGGQTLSGSEFSTQPETVEMTTGASALFATIWPIQNLEVYADAEGKTVVGSAPEGKAFTVKLIAGEMFQIRYEGEKLGYVDSNYCMINLPDYMADRCIYYITNSFESRYMIHNYGIPGITDEVTAGYEYVKQGKDEYLVPLLYPTAQKLEKAANAALEQGYKLKIYDAYRPHKTTRKLYDTASVLLDKLLPTLDYYEKEGVNAQPGGGNITYAMLMTDNGRYNLSYFLAKDGSKHNLGVALDLTLVDLSTGMEIFAQTDIHDLSWYSEIGRNNDHAKFLASVMKPAGFGTLISEWWHFQDVESIDKLDLNNFLAVGVTAECWVADANGWRYRHADGSYKTSCTEAVDGITYRFDAQGYATAV